LPKLSTDGVEALNADLDYTDIRDAVAKLCGEYPSAYWQELDEKGNTLLSL
jgi:hypothetical protein